MSALSPRAFFSDGGSVVAAGPVIMAVLILIMCAGPRPPAIGAAGLTPEVAGQKEDLKLVRSVVT